jgi:hypothetical protein
MNCYVHWNGGAWFVKEQGFFEAQKAESAGGHAWWEGWKLLTGVDGIEHARDKARMQWGERGEHWPVAAERAV